MLKNVTANTSPALACILVEAHQGVHQTLAGFRVPHKGALAFDATNEALAVELRQGLANHCSRHFEVFTQLVLAREQISGAQAFRGNHLQDGFPKLVIEGRREISRDGGGEHHTGHRILASEIDVLCHVFALAPVPHLKLSKA